MYYIKETLTTIILHIGFDIDRRHKNISYFDDIPRYSVLLTKPLICEAFISE